MKSGKFMKGGLYEFIINMCGRWSNSPQEHPDPILRIVDILSYGMGELLFKIVLSSLIRWPQAEFSEWTQYNGNGLLIWKKKAEESGSLNMEEEGRRVRVSAL